MPDRKCLTCKHYEPSPIRHKGWCRNPVLYSPQQSHLVDQDTLDCGRRYGSFWESAVPFSSHPDDRADADTSATERKRLRFFEPRQRLVPAAATAAGSASAGAGMVARSTGGGDGEESGRAPSRGGAGAPGGLPRIRPDRG